MSVFLRGKGGIKEAYGQPEQVARDVFVPAVLAVAEEHCRSSHRSFKGDAGLTDQNLRSAVKWLGNVFGATQ